MFCEVSFALKGRTGFGGGGVLVTGGAAAVVGATLLVEATACPGQVTVPPETA
jgi:hypothetical protein